MTPAQERAAREERERAKALRKYGDTALLPAGRPDYDVFDYMVNELIGLKRYAQMARARLDLMAKLIENRKVQRICRGTKDWTAALEADAELYAEYFLGLRQQLKAAGLHLGTTEEAA